MQNWVYFLSDLFFFKCYSKFRVGDEPADVEDVKGRGQPCFHRVRDYIAESNARTGRVDIP